jgi:hypothetical protein
MKLKMLFGIIGKFDDNQIEQMERNKMIGIVRFV